MEKPNPKRVGLALFLIVSWAFASWVMWSDVGTRVKATPGLNIITLPIALTSWPAHEVCLEMGGQGLGANARAPIAFWAFTVFFAQAILTWLPALVLSLPKPKAMPWLVAQSTILVALFVLFWMYGNG